MVDVYNIAAAMKPHSPSVDGGVNVTEVPFICRDLTVGLHVPFSSEEVELLLCE